MKKIPILLTLILIAAWGYTSWYWYVCNIKGLCDASTYIQTQTVKDDDTLEQSTITNQVSDTPILTANDVLKGDTVSDTPRQELEAEVQEEENSSEETEEELREDETRSASWTIDEKRVENQELNTMCDTPLVGPIVFWGNNNEDEVRKLEDFLITRWERVARDGVYWQDALDAVKKFQLEFKSEVLDPWGITAPTGYVGKTTIQKINEIACNS